MDEKEERSFIEKIGYFFKYILKNLHEHHEQKKNWKIDLDFLGETSLESLSTLFQFFWKLSGWNKDEIVIIIIQNNDEISQYLIEVNSNNVTKFEEISHYVQNEEHRIITIDYNILSHIAEKGECIYFISAAM